MTRVKPQLGWHCYIGGSRTHFRETERELQSPTSDFRLRHDPYSLPARIPPLTPEMAEEFVMYSKGKAGLKLGFSLQTGRRKSRRLGLIIENQPGTPAIVLLHRRLEASPNIVGLHPEGDAGAKLVIHAAARHEPQAGIGANS